MERNNDIEFSNLPKSHSYSINIEFMNKRSISVDKLRINNFMYGLLTSRLLPCTLIIITACV